MTKPITLALLLALAAPAAVADGGRPLPVGDAISIDQAADRVRHDTGGRILSASRRDRGGQQMYLFKVLTPQGRVRKVWVDPQAPAGRRR